MPPPHSITLLASLPPMHTRYCPCCRQTQPHIPHTHCCSSFPFHQSLFPMPRITTPHLAPHSATPHHTTPHLATIVLTLDSPSMVHFPCSAVAQPLATLCSPSSPFMVHSYCSAVEYLSPEMYKYTHIGLVWRLVNPFPSFF